MEKTVFGIVGNAQASHHPGFCWRFLFNQFLRIYLPDLLAQKSQ